MSNLTLELLEAGFSMKEIANSCSQEANDLYEAGFTEQEISSFVKSEYGLAVSKPDETGKGAACVQALKHGVLDIYRNEELAKQTIKNVNAPSSEEPKKYTTFYGEDSEKAMQSSKEAFDPFATKAGELYDKATESAKKEIANVFQASVFGYQNSTTGLALRGELPDMAMPEDADIMDKVAFMAGQTIGDLPTIIAGGLPGLAAGPAAPVAMATSAMALTEGTRASLMELYRKGEVTTFEEGLDVLTAGAKGAGKGAVIGGLAALGGLGASKLASSAIASGSTNAVAKFMKAKPKLTTTASAVLGEELGATAGQAITEQRLPTLEDFMVSAIQVGGIHGGKFYINKLTNTFAKKNVDPIDEVERSVIDPKSRFDLVALNTDIQTAKPAWVETQDRRFYSVKESGDTFTTFQTDRETASTIEAGKAAEEGRVPEAIQEFKLKASEEKNIATLDDNTVLDTTLAYIDELDSEGTLIGKEGLTLKLSSIAADYYSPFATGDRQAKAKQKLIEAGYELFEEADPQFLYFVRTNVDFAYKSNLIEGGDPRLTTTRRVFEGQEKPGAKADGEVAKDVQVVLDKINKNTEIENELARVQEEYTKALEEAEQVAREVNDFSEYNKLEAEFQDKLKSIGKPKELTDRQREIYNKYAEEQALEVKNARLKDQAEQFRTRKHQEYFKATNGPAGYILPNGKAVIFRPDALEKVDRKTEIAHRAREVGRLEKEVKKESKDIQSILDNFGNSIIKPEDKKFSVKELLSRAHTQFVDRLSTLNTGAAKDKVTQSYFTARMFSGVASYVNHVITDQRVEFGTRRALDGKSLFGILKQVDDTSELSKYLLAIKTKESNIFGTELKESLTDALAIINDPVLKAKYKPVVKELKDHMRYLAKYSYDAGLLSKDKYESILASKSSLLPLSVDKSELRLITDEALLSDEPILKALGISRENKEKLYNDPLQSIVMETVATLVAAEKNNVKRSIARSYGKDVKKVPDADLEAIYKALGVESERDITISFKENGESRKFLVPEAIAKTTYNLEARTLEMHNIAFRSLGKIASINRAGAVLNPTFMVTNFFRDQFTAGMQSANGYIPFVDWAKGFMAHMNYVSGGKVFKNYDGVMDRWLRNSGSAGTLLFEDKSKTLEILNNLNRPMAKNVIEDPVAHYKEIMSLINPMNWAKVGLRGLKFGAEVSEVGTRLGEFMRAEQKGLSPMESAWASRNVTMDFQRAGTSAQALNAIIPFFNATIQGTGRLAQSFKDRPLETTSTLVGGLVVPTLLLGLVNADIQINSPDSEMAKQLQSVPPWERAAYWFIPTGEVMLRIPKPHGFNLFTQAIESMCDAAVYEENDLFDNLHRSGFLEAFGNIAGITLLPSALKAPIENIANYSFFTGGPIVPAYLESRLPEMQYKVTTTETAKGIASILGKIGTMSGVGIVQRMGNPILIENMVRGWGGTLGMQVLQGLDYAGKSLGIFEDNAPAKSMADLPLLNVFLYKYEKFGAYQIIEFSDRAREFEQRYNTVKSLLASDNPSERARGEDLLQRYPFVEFNELVRARGELSKAVELIYKNREMTKDEKADMINALYEDMMLMSQHGLSIMDMVEKAWEENNAFRK